MSNKTHKIIGIFAALAILLVVSVALFSLFFIEDGLNIAPLKDPYIKHVIYFSLFQALLSTFLSIFVAIFLASALYRRDFFGKSYLLKLFSMIFVTPTLIVIFGIVFVYGNSGLLNTFLPSNSLNIYGLKGILIAHVFFNAPLATKVFYESLSRIDSRQHQISLQLGLNAYRKFLYLEWPVLKQQLPHLITLIFMLCFTSFAIVLALGGGPSYTTIEVAIYQAIKYDFDLNLAAFLAVLQVIICLFLALLVQKFSKLIVNKSFNETNKNFFTDSKFLKGVDILTIMLAILFFLPPIASIIFSGINDKLFTTLSSAELLKALLNSLLIASFSSIIAMFLGFCIILASRQFKLQKAKNKAFILEFCGMIILLVPSLVISTGLFILLNGRIDMFENALYFVIVVNALMALPFVINSLSQALFSIEQEYKNLCDSLGLKGFTRLKVVEFKALKKTLSSAFALSFILSFGDLSAISLFGSPNFKTLALLLYEQMSSYHMKEAAVSALMLFGVSFLSYWSIGAIFSQGDKYARS